MSTITQIRGSGLWRPGGWAGCSGGLLGAVGEGAVVAGIGVRVGVFVAETGILGVASANKLAAALAGRFAVGDAVAPGSVTLVWGQSLAGLSVPAHSSSYTGPYSSSSTPQPPYSPVSRDWDRTATISPMSISPRSHI